ISSSGEQFPVVGGPDPENPVPFEFDNHLDDIANDIPIPDGWEWVSGIIELSDLPDTVNLTPVSWATFDVQDNVHTTTCKVRNPDMTFNGSTPLTQSITGSIN